MTFLADECCDRIIVTALREAGHDVRYLSEESTGATDTAILKEAARNEYIIVTEDKDFGELVYRLGYETHGIILVRIPDEMREDKGPRMQELLRRHKPELGNRLVVVELHQTRFRPPLG